MTKFTQRDVVIAEIKSKVGKMSDYDIGRLMFCDGVPFENNPYRIATRGLISVTPEFQAVQQQWDAGWLHEANLATGGR